MKDSKERRIEDGVPDEGHHAVDVHHLQEEDVTDGDHHCTVRSGTVIGNNINEGGNFII